MMGSSLALSLGLRALPYLGLAALGGWLYLQGQWSAETRARLAAAQATIAVMEEQSRREAIAFTEAGKAATARAILAQKLQQKVNDYETALKTRGNAGCLLDDVDAGRLRGLD